MPCYPSGELSGFYYIPVSGLPWSCTWQALKDFARGPDRDGAQIDIEHSQVFRGATDGYVMVKGKDNFDKALARLNGGILDNRALLADGRNETGPVMIRDECPMANSRQPHHYPTPIPSPPPSATDTVAPDTPCGSVQSNLDPESPTFQMPKDEKLDRDIYSGRNSPPSPHFTHRSRPPHDLDSTCYGAGRHFYQPISHACSAEIRNPPHSATHMSSTNVSAQHLACQVVSWIPEHHYMPTSHFIYSPTIVYQDAPLYEHPHRSRITLSPTPPMTTADLQPFMIKTEARKMIIACLPPTTRYKDLRLLLEDVLSNLPTRPKHDTSKAYVSSLQYSFSRSKYPCSVLGDPIESLEFVRHADGIARGHAFVTLRSERLARAVVGVVNGMEWMGRLLRAKLTKEGVERRSDDSGPNVGTGKGSRGPMKWRERKDRDRDRDRDRAEHWEGKMALEKEAAHVEEKEEGNQKKRFARDVTVLRKPDAPMVVNGSGKARVTVRG